MAEKKHTVSRAWSHTSLSCALKYLLLYEDAHCFAREASEVRLRWMIAVRSCNSKLHSLNPKVRFVPSSYLKPLYFFWVCVSVSYIFWKFGFYLRISSIRAKHAQLWLKKETDFKTDEHRLRTGRNETLLTETLFCDTDLEKKKASSPYSLTGSTFHIQFPSTQSFPTLIDTLKL